MRSIPFAATALGLMILSTLWATDSRAISGSQGPITSGYRHACAISSAGAAYCWGDNAYGQLGNGTNNNSDTPVAVSGLASGVIAISAGAYHTCALTGNQRVYCWGLNNNGQLGFGSGDSNVPGLVFGFNTVGTASAIAAGSTFTCALDSAGAVQCWGYNGDGELGNGTNLNSSTPVQVLGLPRQVVAITAGGQFANGHACALSQVGAIYCWGANGFGQLGNGTTANSTMAVAVSGLTVGISEIVAGDADQTCALTNAGAAYCWGYNSAGQLGNGSTADAHVPVAVSGLSSGVVSITAGAATCALISNGSMQCWGSAAYGQLGNGTLSSSPTPVFVSGSTAGSTAVAMAAGSFQTCALNSSGVASCWGDNTYGQLGNGTTNPSSVPVTVAGPTIGNATTQSQVLAAGSVHACAIQNLLGTARVLCWGYNAYGQLGNGTYNNSPVPVAVSAPNMLANVAAVSSLAYHTCALGSLGTPQCWGWNGYGQLGNGTANNGTTPTLMTGLSSGVTAVAAGYYHTCALTLVGGVQCAGYNGYGALGDGTTNSSDAPVANSVFPLGGVSAIAAGDNFTCVLTSTSRVWCWGYNGHGELGNGNNTTSLVATNVGLSGVAAIVAGASHVCALLNTGTMNCWGYNAYGQLGNGGVADSNLPVAVLTNVAAMSAGNTDTCAVTNLGATYCWGDNTYGQFGNGTYTGATVPTLVSGGPSAGVAVGAAMACFVSNAGAVSCSGDNRYGELGNGTSVSSNAPVTVQGISVVIRPIGSDVYSDGPVPLWALGALGAGLVGIASIRVRKVA